MKKTRINFSRIILSTLFLIFIQVSVQAQPGTTDNHIRISVKELNSITVNDFIGAKTDLAVKSCIISLEVGSEIKEFSVQSETASEEVKYFLSFVKPGQTIMVQKRLAVADGREKKLPALVYSVIE